MEVIKSRKNQLALHMRKLGTDKAYREKRASTCVRVKSCSVKPLKSSGCN